MTNWISTSDRDDAIAALRRLSPASLRKALNRDIEKLVATAEHSTGRYTSKINDDDVPEFLVDLYGLDLLNNKDLRYQLGLTLSDAHYETFIPFLDEKPTSSREKRAEQISSRRWHAGKQWARFFATSFGFPRSYAGVMGNPAEPDYEDIDPYIPLPSLHDYQQELVGKIQEVLVASKDSGRRALLSLPTGAGKTRTVVEAILIWWGESLNAAPLLLWLAQSDELCEQAVESFREVWIDKGGHGSRKMMRIYRYWGDYNAFPSGYGEGVLIASIQKFDELLNNQDGADVLKQFAGSLAVIVVDEAHHATAPSYTKVLSAFGLEFGNAPQTPVPFIGLTATPYRGKDIEENQRLVRRFYQNLLIPATLGDDPITTLRSRGVLSAVDHQILETGRKFAMTHNEEARYEQLGQLPSSFLQRIGEDPRRNHFIREKILALPIDWPILFFGCSVDHAQAMGVLLRRAGRTAVVVTGTTRRATRRHLIDEFRVGKIQILCNYGVLTTGFDAPKIRAIVIARPTTSVVLYEQMIGRGMRGPRNGGTDICTVIDLADNIERFSGQMAYTRMQEIWD